jgi:hypothetical protein
MANVHKLCRERSLALSLATQTDGVSDWHIGVAKPYLISVEDEGADYS